MVEFKLILYDKLNDGTYEKVDEIQNIIEANWTERCYGYGNITMQLGFTENFYRKLKEGQMIVKYDNINTDYCDFAIIERFNADLNTISIQGYNGKGILRKTLAMGNILVTNVIDDLVKTINLNKRGIDFELIPPNITNDITDNIVYEFDYLGALLNDALERHNIWYDVKYRLSDKKIILSFEKGIDRTGDANINPDYVGYFSDKLGNMINTNLYTDYINHYNYAVVKGDESTYTYINEVKDGQTRAELLIDLSSIKKEYKDYEYTGELDEFGNPVFIEVEKIYTDEEYKQILKDKAMKEFIDKSKINDIISLDFNVNDIDIITYGKDFKIGDILPIKNEFFGVTFNMQIVEVVYLLDVNEGYNLMYNFKEV